MSGRCVRDCSMKQTSRSQHCRRWLLVVITIGCATSASPPPTGQSNAGSTKANIDLPTLADEKPRDLPGLHNVVAYHDGYYSGSVPEGDAGFDTLSRMGVKTIISVDGAIPDVERARRRGMRYIHLPIGYNGFDEQRKRELARATRDATKDGPVYIHCHHGKHRSAGAAGTVAVALGWATPDQMVDRMKVSGTSPSYKGLYACTSTATALPANVLDAVPTDFPDVFRPSGFVKAMIEVDEVYEHLKAIEKAGWVVPKDHPDLVPAAEAGRLVDLYRVLVDNERTRNKPADFAAMMAQNVSFASHLEDLLVAEEKDAKKISAQFQLITASCKDCHVKYRD